MKKVFFLHVFIMAFLSIHAQNIKQTVITEAERVKLKQLVVEYYSNDDNYNKDAKGFDIPQGLRHKDPVYIFLVVNSRSLDFEEKQNWFNLYSVMTEEQKDKLRDILMREAKKLAEINEKYSQKQAEIDKKYNNIK